MKQGMHRVVSSHKQGVNWPGTEENSVYVAQGWEIQLVCKCRGQYFLRFLMTQTDLVEGNKSSSRHLKTAFQKSISYACKCCVGLLMKASPELQS